MEKHKNVDTKKHATKKQCENDEIKEEICLKINDIQTFHNQ